MKNSNTRIVSRKTLNFRWFLLLSCVLFAGCETVTTAILKEPEVSISGFRVINANLINQKFGVKFKLDNPNSVSLPINKISYSLVLANREFANGVTNKAFRVPANGSEEFEVEVNMNILESASYLSTIMEKGGKDLDYSLLGKVEVDLPLLGSVPISKKGKIQLMR